jgi:hypothetical protein
MFVFAPLGRRDSNTLYVMFLELCNELSAMAMVINTLKTLNLKIEADSAFRISSVGKWEKLKAVLSSPRWSCLEHISLYITSDHIMPMKGLVLLTNLPNMQLSHLLSRTTADFKFCIQ